MQIRENYGRDGAEEIYQMARNLGLYSKSYGKGTNSVLVVSKVPLPNYRPEFDRINLEFELNLTDRQRDFVMDALHATSGMSSYRNGSLGRRSGSRNDMKGSRGNLLEMKSPEFIESENKRLKLAQEEQLASERVKKMISFRKKLPAYAKKAELLQQIRESQVLVISGETGCGKTTQIPQFILENAISENNGFHCNIVCTQPRRISAISVADRVAQERGERLGLSVGYQIRLDARKSNDTKLLFCTTGVLLRRLVRESNLEGVSHIIVDEIHERGMNEDFLLIILRDLLPKRPDLRVILMSATLNAESFSRYFGGANIMHIPGFTFPVQQIFLEDILEKTRYRVEAPQSTGGYRGNRFRKKTREEDNQKALVTPERFASYSHQTQDSLQVWAENSDKLDLLLIESVIEYICLQEDEGAILVFLTGWDDITKLYDSLQSNRVLSDKNRFRIVPLHGSMPTANQQKIFVAPPAGVRKVVLATNIAETSITIDDIVYVVDCGKAKEKTYDAVNKLSCLLPTWVSRASVRQRKGRAGRVRPGKCYHVYTSELYENQMAEYQLPEILRTPLEELCLQIKSLQLGSIEQFLGKALEPPDLMTIQNAVELLHTIGALTEIEELTPLGNHLAALPVDPKIGKMIVMGAIFGCLDPILTIAGGLSYRDPFVMPMDKKEVVDEIKREFAAGTGSDHIAILNAYNEWQKARSHGHGRDFCWHNFLSENTLEMISDMRYQFLDILDEAGFFENINGRGGDGGGSTRSAKHAALRSLSQYGHNTELIKAIIVAGTFPNVVAVQNGKRFAKLKTREDGKVELHPSSVNAKASWMPLPWIVYSEKTKTTSGIFIMKGTTVGHYCLLLFGGSVQFGDRECNILHVTYTGSRETMELISDLRDRILSIQDSFQVVDERMMEAMEVLLEEPDYRPPSRSSRPGGGFNRSARGRDFRRR